MMINTSSKNIPLEIEQEIIYLDPNLAEGKALQRIENPVTEDELITLGEIDEEIDLEKVTERIKKRGYKIKVSCENRSES